MGSAERAKRLYQLLALAPPDELLLARTEALLAPIVAETTERSELLAHIAKLFSAEEIAGGPEGILEALGALHLPDVRFALACASGDRSSIAELERTLIDAVPKALTHLKPDRQTVDEVRQDLREKLLVGLPGQPPKLLDYKGRGPLGAWVRVVALRIAYTRRRDGVKEPQGGDEDALADAISGADSPEIAHLRSTSAESFGAAFREAAARLSAEERSVLRSHVVDGLNIDQIGALHQVHRSTAARWVQQARGSLLSALHESLAHRFGIDRSACESVVALVGSRIDLSLERLLEGPVDD
jgi:RNA polymerase sigma-70 factor (ECF subfamily)